jgi:Uma2 family endonuclease
MTALPEWMTSSADGLTPADYEALPEEVCRQIEVVDGAVVVSPSPRRAHQRVAQQLLYAIDEACPIRYIAVGDVDLRLRDLPLLNRRPDIVVYDATLPDEEVLRPQHCLLVVEVMSPGSITTDQQDKPSEYAAAGIEHFWRVENYADSAKLTVFRYRLDPTTRTYASAGADTGLLDVNEPFSLTVTLAELVD